ncbi:MAG: AMP-binding protein [Desulfobulbus sp.]|nr:AMP-binding protein [Desulfobulbus sp.]
MNLTTLEPLVASAIGQEVQPLSRAAIEEWQLRQLRNQLGYCRERSSFYRQHLQNAKPASLESFADVAQLPFVTEADLRASGAKMVCVSQDAISRIITMHSSGTTGAPKRLFFTAEDLDSTLDFFHLGMQHMVDPGQRVAILLPGATPDSTGHLLARALERFQVTSHIIGLVTQPDEAVRALAQLHPDALVGFPVQILAIARMAEYLQISLGKIRSVLLCSDYIPQSLSAELESLWGCEIFTHYGTTETGLGGGVDCWAHCGTHLREADLLFEIIDPHRAQPLADGQWGEIVFSTLIRNGMPLIRYRTGDLGRILPGTCPCGSSIRRLDQVRGRLNQVRSLENGHQLGMHDLDEALFPLPGLLDFSACLQQTNNREQLCLRLKLLPSRSEFWQHSARELLSTIPAVSGLGLSFDAPPETTIHPAKRTLDDHRKDIQS